MLKILICDGLQVAYTIDVMTQCCREMHRKDEWLISNHLYKITNITMRFVFSKIQKFKFEYLKYYNFNFKLIILENGLLSKYF